MAEEKRGLLSRLFGRRNKAAEPHSPEDTTPEALAGEGLPPEAAAEPALLIDEAAPAEVIAPAAAETIAPEVQAAEPVLADAAPEPVEPPIAEPPVFQPEPVVAASVAPPVIEPLPGPDGTAPATVGETPGEPQQPAVVADEAAASPPVVTDGPVPSEAVGDTAAPVPPSDEVPEPEVEVPEENSDAAKTAEAGADRRFFAEASDEAPEEAAPAQKSSWLQRLRSGLSRTTQSLAGGISSLFTKRKLDVGTLQDLEDLLIQADLGVETATAIADRISDKRYAKGISDDEVRRILAEEIEARLAPVARPLALDKGEKPHVVLVVGVNGTGKTTTIGKISAQLRAHGRSVMLAAGDTFRAAAIAQLKIWGERTGAKVIARSEGSDAASLAFDAMKEAREEGVDVLLIDTAGRLQNRAELMAELEKVIRVIRKHDPTAPHDVILTLDATTGQNAMRQVEIFGKTAGVTGLVMTKLDGTARGGILVAIAARHGLPVHFIGVGEGIDDLEPFDARDFARAIAGLDA